MAILTVYPVTLATLFPINFNRVNFKTCIKPGCKTLLFSDTTGAYNALTNTTGWGAPNPTLPNYTLGTTFAFLAIYKADLPLSTSNLESPLAFVNITALGFPTTDTCKEIEISASQLGFSDNIFTDGRYTLLYAVVDTTASSGNKLNVKIEDVGFYCNVECCIDKKFIKALNSSCICDETKLKEATRGKAILNGLIASLKSGKKDNFDNTLKVLQKICHKCGCGDTNTNSFIGQKEEDCGCK